MLKESKICFLTGFGGSMAGDDFVVWFAFHKIIIRGTLKWHINAFSTGRRVKCGPRQNKRGFLFEHTGVSLLCVATEGGVWMEKVWGKYKEKYEERNSSCALHAEPAPEAYARNKGLCGCIFWLSERPEVECFYSWVLFYTLCWMVHHFQGIRMFYWEKTPKQTSKHFEIYYVAPTWYVLS